jgi:hypothetical protein
MDARGAEALVRRLGGDPEDSGSFMGKTHQRFEDLKAAITGRDEKSIINEVERGEDYIKGKYEAALNDGDPRIVHLGLTAMGDTAPPRLLDRVIDLALASDLGEDTRLLAVNSFTRARRADVLDALLQLSVGGRSLFGRTRLLPKTPVLVAVIRALATTWADDPRASGVLTAAARSADPELRQAVSAQTR